MAKLQWVLFFLTITISIQYVYAEEFNVQIVSIKKDCVIDENCFLPMTVKIALGDSVTWIYAGETTTIANVTTGDFFRGVVTLENPTFSHTFNQVGTFEYFSLTYPWMKGTVEVREFYAPPIAQLNFTAPTPPSPPEILPEEIPSWVKNSAKWWAVNTIEDSDFLNGIKYLINKEIIVLDIPNVVSKYQEKIPEWVRNNAAWWADDIISDDEFLNGIKFLISKGIIQISQSYETSPFDTNVSIKVWKDFQRINIGFIGEQVIEGGLKGVPNPSYDIIDDQPHAFYDVFVTKLPTSAPINYQESLDNVLEKWMDANPNLHFRYTKYKTEGDLWVAWRGEPVGDEGDLGHATLGKGVVEVQIGDKNCNGLFELYDEATLEYIMLHEIGHSVGVFHVDDPEHLMYYTIPWIGYKYCVSNQID